MFGECNANLGLTRLRLNFIAIFSGALATSIGSTDRFHFTIIDVSQPVIICLWSVFDISSYELYFIEPISAT